MSEVSTPTFVDEDKRSEVVPLEWPIAYDGVVYDRITVRRPTTAMVRAWSDEVTAAQARGETGQVPLPVYDAPAAVILALDPDDDEQLGEVAKRFLPRMFRA